MSTLAKLLKQFFCLRHKWVGDWAQVVPLNCSAFRCAKCEARRVIYAQ